MTDQGSGIGDQGSGATPKKRTWIWIVVGVFAFLFVAAVGGSVFVAYWLGNHMEIIETPVGDATSRFDAVRARFQGQQPLLEFRDGETLKHMGESTPASTVELTTLHILAFDQSEGKEGRMVSVDVPFWLLRLQSGPIAFGDYASGFDDRRINLSVADIERRGPGIVLDITEPDEGRVLIWAE